MRRGTFQIITTRKKSHIITITCSCFLFPKMDEGKYYDEAIRYLAEDMTNEERTGFEAFLDGDPLRKEELEVLRKLWANTAAYDSKPPETDVQKQWERFSNGAFIEESKVVPLNRRWRQLSRIAAACRSRTSTRSGGSTTRA